MNWAVHKEEFAWQYIFDIEYFRSAVIAMRRTSQNPLADRIFNFFLLSYWLESSNYRLERMLGGHLVQPHAESRLDFTIRWCCPRPCLVKLCVSLGAGMLQSPSVFLCSTAPHEKNFLPSFKRQVRKHLFPVLQKRPGVSWTPHSLGIAVHMPGDKDICFSELWPVLVLNSSRWGLRAVSVLIFSNILVKFFFMFVTF